MSRSTVSQRNGIDRTFPYVGIRLVDRDRNIPGCWCRHLYRGRIPASVFPYNSTVSCKMRPTNGRCLARTPKYRLLVSCTAGKWSNRFQRNDCIHRPPKCSSLLRHWRKRRVQGLVNVLFREILWIHPGPFRLSVQFNRNISFNCTSLWILVRILTPANRENIKLSSSICRIAFTSPLLNTAQAAVAANSKELQSMGTPSNNTSITRPVQKMSFGSWKSWSMAFAINGSIGFLSTFTASAIEAITEIPYLM